MDGGEASQAALSWGGEPTSGGWLRSKYSSGSIPTPTHTHVHAHTPLPPNSRGTVGSEREGEIESEGGSKVGEKWR